MMMNKANSIPKDVLGLCEQVAKGYERRKKNYHNRRNDIVFSNAGVDYSKHTGAAKGSDITDPCALKTQRLEQLENGLDFRLIRAVDEAALDIGTDVPREMRDRLKKAILLNCEDGREYPFEYLGIDEFSRRDFYRRRKRFLMGIGAALGLIEEL